MHVSVQKFTSTTRPSRSAGPRGSEFSHPVAPSNVGIRTRSNRLMSASVRDPRARRGSDVARAVARLRVLAQERVERVDGLLLEAAHLVQVARRAGGAALAVLAQRLADRGGEAGQALLELGVGGLAAQALDVLQELRAVGDRRLGVALGRGRAALLRRLHQDVER